MLSINTEPNIMARRPTPRKRPAPTPRYRWYLREWRKHRNLSQERLAGMVGYTQGMISQLEKNTVDYTATHLIRLSAALECSIRDLLFRPPTVEEDATAVLESFAEPAEQRRAIEMLKTLRRMSQ